MGEYTKEASLVMQKRGRKRIKAARKESKKNERKEIYEENTKYYSVSSNAGNKLFWCFCGTE